ncbi:hypothetical protein C2W62_24130 [Candidatus Entotheonella serta]|nr:hypothetical protein C2W62_24130 [Candidatus Entotheonella serta]
MTNLMTLETLRAQSSELSVLITCTETEVTTLTTACLLSLQTQLAQTPSSREKVTTACLLSLQTQLAQTPSSREKVTDAVVGLWTSLHLGFLSEHGLEPGPQVTRLYELSGMWLRQRLLAVQFANAAAAMHFAEYVTIGTPPGAPPCRLFEALLGTAQTHLAASGLSADTGFLAASEIVADMATELYGIERLPHGLDLWPLVASRLRWQRVAMSPSFMACSRWKDAHERGPARERDIRCVRPGRDAAGADAALCD